MTRTLLALVLAAVGPPLFAQQEPPKGEELPPAPKADAKSELTALQPDKSLYLEKKPDGSRRVLVVAEVCLREGPLEVFVTKKGTKEHESILRISQDARFIHAALEAAGAKVGTPVQFVNPKTMEDDYKAATGPVIKATVHYTKDGKAHTHAAQEWVTNKKTKKPMTDDWVFAGGRFIKNPDAPNAPPFYSANNGVVLGLSNDYDAMLDLPVQVTKDDAFLIYEARTEKIPQITSKVWLILEPEAAKKK
jgi:hypothetical protein